MSNYTVVFELRLDCYPFKHGGIAIKFIVTTSNSSDHFMVELQ